MIMALDTSSLLQSRKLKTRSQYFFERARASKQTADHYQTDEHKVMESVFTLLFSTGAFYSLAVLFGAHPIK